MGNTPEEIATPAAQANGSHGADAILTDVQGAEASLASFGVAKFLSWASLVVIVMAGLALSIVIANQARQTLQEKQQEFSLLLAQNLNHQIYRRFILPTLVGFGRVELKEKAQYDRLENVIQSTIHGLQIQELRIYDIDGVVSFSTDRSTVGREDLVDADVRRVTNLGAPLFSVLKREDAPFWSRLHFNPAPGSVVMKMNYPLRIPTDLGDDADNGTLVGVLEIRQDIAGVQKTAVRFQWLIILVTLVTSLILFLVLLMIIRRADKVNAMRLQERDRMERELHQNEKLASMGRTVASIAHEIRNPLGIIRSSSELLLKKQTNENDLHARILKAIHDEAVRLSQTVSDFLDYARPRNPRQDPVDLAQVLEQVLVFLEHECQKNAVVVDRRLAREVVIPGDKDLLYRAFYNIVGNSLQAMNGPGQLEVELSAQGKEAVLTVRDSGPGFDPARKHTFTDPFVTTKDQGTGLGLAITKNIIQSHGGVLALDNHPEGGAVVTARFHLARPSLTRGAPASRP